jgi:hypothetical protein
MANFASWRSCVWNRMRTFGTTPMTRNGTCQCGQLQVTCEGEPRRVSLCHCVDCQRRTGSAFSIAAFYDRGSVTCKGTSSAFTRDSASVRPVTFYFCNQCGSNVYWEPARMPDLIGVAVGAFGAPDFPRPEQSVWTKDKHAWVSLPDGIPTK